MILTDREILAAIKAKRIAIDPDPGIEAFSSTSLDLTLDSQLLMWRRVTVKGVEAPIIRPSAPTYSYTDLANAYSDLHTMSSDGWVLEPDAFVLGWTHEKVSLPVESCLAARVEGKSSLARLGVGVHITAPTIHAGFAGQIQLEIANHGPHRVRLDPGLKICQLIFEQCLGTPQKGYAGQFLGQGA